jgi:hypothetical protein
MMRKIGIVLFLYYAAGTCVSQGATAPSGGSPARTIPEQARSARVVICSGTRAQSKQTKIVTGPSYNHITPESRAQ